MSRAICVLLLMAWAWGAGAVYAVGGAKAKFCDNPMLNHGPLLAFGWPIAVIGITLEGGWGKSSEAPCP